MDIVRNVDLTRGGEGEGREWIVTNGLGGYASSTLSGAPSRRFHSWLVAALPAPLGRATMLNHIAETLRFPDGRIVLLGGSDVGLAPHIERGPFLTGFRLENGLPVWRYEAYGFVIEKRALLIHGQNTVHIGYAMREGSGVARLQMRPSVCFRAHEGSVAGSHELYALHAWGDRYEITGDIAYPLRMYAEGDRKTFTLAPTTIHLVYEVEKSRGYDHEGSLQSPGFFRADLSMGHDVTLVASTEAWGPLLAMPPVRALHAERDRRAQLLALAPERLRTGLGAELVLAADEFVIAPASRVEEEARAHASGDEARTIIAGYHWFTDWGRDTMISLDGLTLLTGRHHEAGRILRTFANHVRNGLVPNMFPEGKNEGLYHTADASLWFFHAVSRYIDVTGDRATLRAILPTLRSIADAHLAGTHFGIAVDPEDGLLRQGAPGYQLTWMDAKVGDWVVTPRRGKAVEINALFYNALQLLARWLREENDDATIYEQAADRAQRAFNARFWFAEGGYLYDVIDGEQGDDPACRPNQLFAISLPNPILDPARFREVLDVCRRDLLTPVGLRSLAPGHPDYKRQYFGDLRARDAAYHQGTVWAWLIGPFADAWRKVHPQDTEAIEAAARAFSAHLDEHGIGSVSEVFDADPPFTPRGCIAQAWSVAEALRCVAMLPG